MKAVKNQLIFTLPVCLSVFFLVLMAWSCGSSIQQVPSQGATIILKDLNRPVSQTMNAIEIGDTLAVGLTGLSQKKGVYVYLTDDMNKEWSFARLYADEAGTVQPFLFWYHTGVIGTTSRKIDFKPDPSFTTFEEAAAYFKQHPLTLTIKSATGQLLKTQPLTVNTRQKPLLYPGNKGGILMNGFHHQKEDVYAVGKNFPAGSTIRVFTVKNKFTWKVGDPLTDISGKNGQVEIETITLSGDQKDFNIKIWDAANSTPGSYDIVARIQTGQNDELKLYESDILTYNRDTGFIYYHEAGGHFQVQSAGQLRGIPAEFQFKKEFEKNQDIYCTVDPVEGPAQHRGGNYAGYYIVKHQPASYWDGINPRLNDVTGGAEMVRVKYGAMISPLVLSWLNAIPEKAQQEYDVIIDFGSTVAQSSADLHLDLKYNKGVDLIAGYNSPAFKLTEKIAASGPYPIGTVELNEPEGISGITDPEGVAGPQRPIQLAWARIMYPAVSAGTNTPVSNKESHYPVALFLHGRHFNRDEDGSGPGLIGSYSFDCPVEKRIPSHEGYNYIMEELASYGIFCISISGHDIQPGLGLWDYETRGRLILKYLDKLRDWNNNGSDPFGGIFKGKLDMSKIALSGHSRGGEGVVAAQQLNISWPNPHSIVAVNAIAPTDQNLHSYRMTRAPYFLLLGARDGDVFNMQGFRTYDRAYIDETVTRYPKTVAFVYGANHNYFNTIWTDSEALGSTNPWAGAKDDAELVAVAQKLSAKEQRAIAMVTVSAFFRYYLQGKTEFKDILTAKVEPEGIPNEYIYWTYQDIDRVALDNFEQLPQNKKKNTMGGEVEATGFSHYYEILLNNDNTDYDDIFEKDDQFYHDTLGLRLSWSEDSTLTTKIPAQKRDISRYTYLIMRVGLIATDVNHPFSMTVNMEDTMGHKMASGVRSDQYDIVPRPYARAWPESQVLMTGVRIPLSAFTANGSNVDLKNIAKITIRVTYTGGIGLDDIEFSN